SGGRVISRSNKRTVATFSVDRKGASKVFFMKRYIKPHLKDMFFTWRAFGQFCSQGRFEWESVNFLIENGIETYRPVCFGEQTKWWLERGSFLVTDKLQGESLADFISREWKHLERSKKEQIIAGLGAFIRKIHKLNVSLPDLYIWHIFLTERQGRWEFAVIDLHRMLRNVTSIAQQLRNLGRLDHSMTDKYFDEQMRRLLIESYADADWPGSIDELAAKVKKYSKTMSARRNPKPY
ncbi:lipopolysaccharide kinase InaA family protein, partial [Planctomycetota bacterium]